MSMIQKCITTSLEINHVGIDNQTCNYELDSTILHHKVHDLECDNCVFLCNRYLLIIVIEELFETNDS